jgi:hypothetical protein
MAYHYTRPFDAIRGHNGFDEVRRLENFKRTCDEIQHFVRANGPWAILARQQHERYESCTEKTCVVCQRTKSADEYRISKVHKGKISRGSTCKECLRISRRMAKWD